MKAPKSNRSERTLHPIGAAAAVCVQIVDLGTVFNEKKQKHEHKIRIDFESAKLTEDGKPFLISSTFNFSMFQNSHLRNFIENWTGSKFSDQDAADNFEFGALLRKPAFINVIHNNEYANIGTIMPLPDGMPPPSPTGKAVIFDLDNPSREAFDALGQKTQDRIKQSEEWKALKQPKQPEPVVEPEFDDDIPW